MARKRPPPRVESLAPGLTDTADTDELIKLRELARLVVLVMIRAGSIPTDMSTSGLCEHLRAILEGHS